MLQMRMITRLRGACREDERVSGALMTALFEDGVRGEFHFMRASDVSVVESWRGYGWFPPLDAAVLLGRTGELSRHAAALVGGPPAREEAALAEARALNLLNLTLLGANLLNRGEYARACALLSRVHENLLKLVRLQEGTTDHRPTLSRALEGDLSATAYRRYVTCTAGAQPDELCAAYRESSRWGRELFGTVAGPRKSARRPPAARPTCRGAPRFCPGRGCG